MKVFLTIRGKLIATVSLFLLPIGLFAVLYVQQALTSVHFAEAERLGVTHIRTVWPVMLQAATLPADVALDPEMLKAERRANLALAETNKAGEAGADLGRALAGSNRSVQVASAHAVTRANRDAA